MCICQPQYVTPILQDSQPGKNNIEQKNINIMTHRNLNLPSITKPREFFLTDLTCRDRNKVRNTVREPRDRSEVFSKFMDSAITKKVQTGDHQQENYYIETERRAYFHEEEENLVMPRLAKEKISLRGTKSVFKFYQNYKELDRIMEVNKVSQVAQSPFTAMLQKSKEIGAFPSTMGIIRNKGKGNSIAIPNYCLGDNKSEIISAAMERVSGVQELILSKNRLTDKGMDHIMCNITSQLVKLNLSDNKITRIHPVLLKTLGVGTCKLTYLNLENNKINDQTIKTLGLILSMNKSVKYLNIGRNHITRESIQALAQIIELSPTLEELYIHWNKINGPNTKAIFEKLEANTTITVLDYSHNVISQGSTSVASAVAQLLTRNVSLVHLDLSFNNFDLSQSKEIAEGLKANRTIYGFHFQGNFGYVDYKGFLKFQDNEDNFRSENGHVKIQSLDVVHRRPKLGLALENLKDVCWICEGWSEQEFNHSLDFGKDKFAQIHINFDGYKPKTIAVENGHLMHVQMFPPHQTKFYFFTNQKEFILPDFEVHVEKLDFRDSQKTTHKVSKMVNVVEKTPMPLFEDGVANTRVVPRTPDVLRKELKKKWNFRSSVWAKQWKNEDQDTLKKCFERDWGHSKISNIVKNPEEQTKLKSLLQSNYKIIKEIYKFYSSWSPFDNVWAVSGNAFTEFCNEAKIIGKDLPLKIVDLTFITTNSISGADWKSSSMVPQRGLVRFQFLEVVVRLADEKFKKSGQVSTIIQATTAMLANHLSIFTSKTQSQTWRQNVFFVEEVDFLIKKYRSVFANIFKRNSKLKVKPGQKPFMCLDQFKSICDRSGMMASNVTERSVYINFNASFMTQVEELESDRILKMSQIEMIDAFGRMANQVNFCNLSPSMTQAQRQSRPFYLKMQELIYVLIQTICIDDIRKEFLIPQVSIFQDSKDDDQ